MAVIKFDDNPPDRTLRQFGLIWFPLFWAIVGFITYRVTGSLTLPVTAFAVALLIGLYGASRVAFIRPIFLLWMYAAFPIGWVVSHVVLGAIYYLVVSPIGLIMRLVGYDPLQRRIDRRAQSYWTPVEQPANKTAYFRQF